MPATLVCTSCGRDLPATLEYFPARRARPGGPRHGLNSWCWLCVRMNTARWQATHREHHNATHRAWYARHKDEPEFKAKRRQQGKRYRLEKALEET